LADTPGGVTYAQRDEGYFARRGLTRHAGVWSVWALGVGAVISGHFSGWNFGFATGGWGGMLVAAAIIAVMYLGLTLSIAEMSAALPHTGAAYSFARTAMGPWGGFITGLFENIEYVLAPAVVVTFIGGYAGSIFGIPGEWQPALWVAIYAIFLALNIFGAALSFRVTLVVTLASLAVLAVFWISAIPRIDFTRWALDIGPDGTHLTEGNGPLFPFGWSGTLATLPFAVWLFLAIEQVPLAAEESIDPRRDMPRGILLAFGTLVVSAFLIVLLNPSVAGIGSFALSKSGEPLLDGFRALYGDTGAAVLGAIALTGLVASFHTILYAQGRQIYSLSRAGYFPTALSITHRRWRTPHVAMVAGSILGLGVVMIIWLANGGPVSDWVAVSAIVLNMVVFGAMLSYIAQALSFILLRRNHASITRPFRSPLGLVGAILTIVIAVVTLTYQLQDPAFNRTIPWVIAWLGIGIAYFAVVGHHRLILSPEEQFALDRQK
jgi:ethanolamine permease